MMAEAEDRYPLLFKRKAITTLFPYAVWQERDGRPEMVNAILHAARASRMLRFMWYRIAEFISTLFSEASPRAAILASPYIPWYLLTDRQDLVQWWATVTSIAPHTEEVAQGVVDTLLQIALRPDLLQHVSPEAWSWLTRRPSLPLICREQYHGTNYHVVEATRALKNIEVLKSYFLLVWSEWDCLFSAGLDEMCISILEDFSGTGMGQHRVDLIKRLDHVLGQLDRGLEYLRQHDPDLDEYDVQTRKKQYRKLRETLLGVNTQVIGRTSSLAIPTLCVLTPPLDAHRIPHRIYVCTPSPVSVVTGLERSIPRFHTSFAPLLWYHPFVSLFRGLLLFILSFLSRATCNWGGFRSNLLQCSPLVNSSRPCRMTMFCILSSYSLTTPTGRRCICSSFPRL